MASLFAKVVIDSPLPQLDRAFEYSVPEALQTAISVGSRVRVPFGRAAGLVDGFVTELGDQKDYAGTLAELGSVTSSLPALAPNIHRLARAIADRQAASLNDVIKLAVPARSVAVEKRWLEANSLDSINQPEQSNQLQTFKIAHLAAPLAENNIPSWCSNFIQLISAQFENGFSTIVSVPDFRDLAVLAKALSETAFCGSVVDYSASRTNSKRYASFLQCLSRGPKIVIGNRAAIYAPVQNLGLICIWDDGDSSHIEPSSPYSHTREVALVRQSLENCSIVFSSHSRSLEVQRLVEIGYLESQTDNFKPLIRATESETRVDGKAWQAIREALKTGAVLVQVSSKGVSKSAYCSKCSDRAKCSSCNGPIWIDNNQLARCRWCYSANMNFACASCGSKTLRAGRPGATRTITEFGKAFPSIQIIESTGDQPIEWLKAGPKLVVSTPGAEPRVDGGYVSIILLDCNDLISRDSLRATEEAIRVWSNAVALMAPQAEAMAVGLAGPLAKSFVNWSQQEIASRELQQRRELRFPPAVRMASLSGERDLLQKVLDEISGRPGVEILGPMPLSAPSPSSDWRAILRFEYSQGAALAALLKAQVLQATAGAKRVSAKSGRSMRPIKINMDDTEVI